MKWNSIESLEKTIPIEFKCFKTLGYELDAPNTNKIAIL